MLDINEIKNELELNDDIDEEIEDVLKEVVDDIFKYFEKKSYTRWIHGKDVARVMRYTRYNIASKEDDMSYAIRPQMGGYHLKPDGINIVKRKISIKKDTGVEKKCLSHENIHAIVNGLGGFNKFWGEGITECLNKFIRNNREYSYMYNVKSVYIMAKMFGPIIFRDFLMKEGDTFFLRLAEKIDRNGNLNELNAFTSKTFQDFEEMNQALELFHESAYATKSRGTQDDGKNYLNKAIEILIDKYFEYEKAQIKDLKYYKKGNFDIKKFNDKLNKVKVALNAINYNMQDFENRYDELVEDLLENTHFLEGFEGEEREAKKEYMKNAIKNQSDLDQKSDEVFRTANENFEMKVLKNVFSREKFIEKIGVEKTRFSYQKLFDTLYKIKGVTGISNEEMFKFIEDEKIVEGSANLIEAFEKYEKIKMFETKKRESYCKIKTSPVIVERDGKAFLVQREDNEYKLLLLDKKTGNIEDIDLKDATENGIIKVKKIKEYTGWDESLPDGINTNLIYDDEVYEIEGLSEDGTKDYISIDTQNNKIIFENSQETIMSILEEGFYNLKEAGVQNFVEPKCMSIEESANLIKEIVDRSKQITTLSNFAATIHEMDKEEELQK